MSIELTGEELNRRYHELCGWSVRVDVQIGYPPNIGRRVSRETLPLPALHLDANLAFAELRKVLKESRAEDMPAWYELRINQGEPVPATVLTMWRSKRMDDGLLYAECFAASGPAVDECNAILKALIAAREGSR